MKSWRSHQPWRKHHSHCVASALHAWAAHHRHHHYYWHLRRWDCWSPGACVHWAYCPRDWRLVPVRYFPGRVYIVPLLLRWLHCSVYWCCRCRRCSRKITICWRHSLLRGDHLAASRRTTICTATRCSGVRTRWERLRWCLEYLRKTRIVVKM